MNKVFNSYKEFQEEQTNVYNFHDNVTATIVDLLKKTGTVAIPEDDNYNYRFTYFGIGGTSFTIKEVRINPDFPDTDFILDAVSDYDGREVEISSDDVNNDMIIEDKILRHLFDKYNEMCKDK